jgi:hypothetical protein
MADIGLRGGKKRFRVLDALHGIKTGFRQRVILRGQSLDLLNTV